MGKSALGRRSAAWKLWLAFLADKPGIVESDFSDTNCALFTAFMFQRRKANGSTYEITTITSYISGIRAVIAESIGGEPSRTGHMSAQMLRGCANLRPKKSRVRKPVTVEMLGKLLPDFDLSKAIDRSTWAVITTAVHGLCRLGELAPETHAGEFYPRRKDYSLSAEGRANIFIARSKTDVNHEGFHLPIPRNGTATCPHRALVEAVAAGAPGRLYSAPEDPLFPDSSNRAVLKYYVVKRLRKALTRAGYNAAEFSGHSLRKGGAQSLFNRGLDMRDIACMGRWVIGSQSLRLYREITDDARDAWATLCAAPTPDRVTLSFEELRQVAMGTARSAAQKGEVIAADVQLSESESDSD